jgi:hypothetical protein
MKPTRPPFEDGFEKQYKRGLKGKMEFLVRFLDRPFQSTRTTFLFAVFYIAAGYDYQLGNIPIPIWVGLPMSFFPDNKSAGPGDNPIAREAVFLTAREDRDRLWRTLPSLCWIY